MKRDCFFLGVDERLSWPTSSDQKLKASIGLLGQLYWEVDDRGKLMTVGSFLGLVDCSDPDQRLSQWFQTAQRCPAREPALHCCSLKTGLSTSKSARAVARRRGDGDRFDSKVTGDTAWRLPAGRRGLSSAAKFHPFQHNTEGANAELTNRAN